MNPTSNNPTSNNPTSKEVKYIVQMPKSYIELILALNVITFNNFKKETVLIFNEELNEKKKLLSTKAKDLNFFDKFLIGKNDNISKYFTGDNKMHDSRYKRIELFDLFTKTILSKNVKLGIKDIFNHEFSSKQLLTRQYVRKKIKNKEMVLFHINKLSIKNIVYYLLSIQALYKIDQIDDETRQYKINNDYCIVLFCDSEKKEQENIIVCQQIYHQITLIMPEMKEIICIGNILLADHIENNKTRKENGVLILYNLSSYINVITDLQLLLCISLYPINSSNYMYPNKLISTHIKNAIEVNLKTVEINKIKSQEEINGRFYPI